MPTFNGFTVPLPRECRLHFPGLYSIAAGYVRVTPLRKMGVGFFLCAAAFAVCVPVEVWIEDGHRPSIGWQLCAYVVLTTSEVLVSITGLEFSYTQAPPTMKSLVMATYLLATSLGNLITMLVNLAIVDADGEARISNVQYYTFFVGFMLISAVAFVPYAACFRERVYVQGAAVTRFDTTATSHGTGSDPDSRL